MRGSELLVLQLEAWSWPAHLVIIDTTSCCTTHKKLHTPHCLHYQALKKSSFFCKLHTFWKSLMAFFHFSVFWIQCGTVESTCSVVSAFLCKFKDVLIPQPSLSERSSTLKDKDCQTFTLFFKNDLTILFLWAKKKGSQRHSDFNLDRKFKADLYISLLSKKEKVRC